MTDIALDPSENPYLGKMLAKSASVMIWISNSEKECVYFNDSWLAFTGKTLEQEYGFGWAKGVHPDDFDRCLEIFTQAFDAREVFSMNYRLLRSDGQYRWIRDDGAPYFDPDGHFIGYIGSCFDIHHEAITTHKQLELAQREYRETITRLPTAVIVYSIDKGITLCNAEATRILGLLSQAQLIGKQFQDMSKSVRS